MNKVKRFTSKDNVMFLGLMFSLLMLLAGAVGFFNGITMMDLAIATAFALVSLIITISIAIVSNRIKE